jgi:hypothetical protein
MKSKIEKQKPNKQRKPRLRKARVSTRFFVWYNYFKNIYTFLLKKFAGVNICCIFTL